ncbi:ABC transporter substrate-binding protein [Aureimonas fodinaquatilis]|uniref:ABC transporter substrate-binding protein n=1 Tax=Aureimonas fodinaquatilis TaxID=2565783 RepID=A0A5B0DPY6_9HYPH|nr:ABC transporter substrate-binding protein [Aureimonas fodinaquatilis]KAA0968473.1 ABC transporter substrate-binding protein [Aureimonas fodinaquatilis]
MRHNPVSLLCMAWLVLAGPAAAVDVQDAHDRAVSVTDASRIVSIGGPVTEILYALGVGDNVIARDTTSVFPAQALEKPDVGYMRALSAEGVLSLEPTLVLAVDGSGPQDVIEQLEGAQVAFVNIPDSPSPQGVADKIRAVALAVGKVAEGEQLAQAVLADFAALDEALSNVDKPARAIFVLGITSGSPMIGGTGTSADGVLKLARAENVLSDMNGFKPGSPEAILTAQPDVVVTMNSQAHGLTKLSENPVFAATPAGQNERVIGMDGSYLLGFGPRAAHAVRDLAASLYPDINIPQLPDRPWVGPIAE